MVCVRNEYLFLPSDPRGYYKLPKPSFISCMTLDVILDEIISMLQFSSSLRMIVTPIYKAVVGIK